MKNVILIGLLYITAVNAAGFFMFLADKLRAVKNKWRIPEKVLISVCAVGGSAGGLLGMKLFRHKTKHLKFRIGVPAILIIQLVVSAAGTIFAADMYVERYSEKYMVCPSGVKLDAIIVPGARVYGGRVSAVLRERLDAAVKLYNEGASDKIIVSGDHHSTDYDEVNAMRNYLVEKGIDADNIFMDHAGFDTYSTMYRARDVFAVRSAAVTSQLYHNKRAVYIGRKLGIEAYGFAAGDVYIGRLAVLREKLARVKAVVYTAFRKKPMYLGKVIPLSGSGRETEDGKS